METIKKYEIRNNIIKELHSISYRNGQNIRTIFEDFCSVSMAAFHNLIYTIGKFPVPDYYKNNHSELEAEFECKKSKYGDKIFQAFTNILGTLALHTRRDYFDYLGEIYMEINANFQSHGQFFTPSHICEFMAKIVGSNKIDFENKYAAHGYVSFSDSCCGSGAMAIGHVKELENLGIEDIDTKLYVELQDIDITCVRIAFLNMAMLGISARVIWGDALAKDKNYPFYDTPCLQVALMQGRFWLSQNAEKKRIDKTADENNLSPTELPKGQLSLF